MRASFTIGLLITASLGMTAAAQAAGYTLAMDEVRTVTFAAPVSTVYVGNPSIADINMIDARHAFVIGKGFGTTNIVALNTDGKQVANTHIAVLSRTATAGASLVLNRGVDRVTYSCSSNACEATPGVGDDKSAFDQINSQLAAHTTTARGAAGK